MYFFDKCAHKIEFCFNQSTILRAAHAQAKKSGPPPLSFSADSQCINNIIMQFLHNPSIGVSAQLCAVVAFLVYLNSLSCDLVFDDVAAVSKNRDLHPTTSWLSLLSNDFWGQSLDYKYSHKSYRPLTVATFRLNYMLHELEPLGYHLVNVLLHSAVCYLYVLLCGVVFSEVWPALIAGLLFAVHPIHTEAVSLIHIQTSFVLKW